MAVIMMYRIIKIIQIFFLFLAVSVFNAHMIIPHDHHQADFDLCSENSTPFSKTGGTHHPGIPGHCHAFNNLASERATSLLIKKQAPFQNFVPDIVHVEQAADIQLLYESIIDISIPPLLKGSQGLSSLRAPPAFM